MSSRRNRVLYSIAASILAATASLSWAGNWGAAFDPIGMHGTDLINISGSDCLPGTTDGGFFYVNGFGDNNCVVSLLDASVTLTDLPDTTDTAQLTFVDIGSSDSGNIWGIDLASDGTLLGVDSFLIGPQFAPEGSNPVFNGPWWIQLDAGDGEPPPGSIDAPPTFINTVQLFGGSCDGNCTPDTTPTYIAHVVGNAFFPVPEPGSLSLLLGALAAGWAVKRRRAR